MGFGEEETEGGSETPQDPFSSDQWKEGAPRKANGQFGKGGGSSSSNQKTSDRHKRVKSRERKPLNMSDTEKAVLRNAVAQKLFDEEEKANGYAMRNTSQYKYWVKIDDADTLSYTPIRRWKNK